MAFPQADLKEDIFMILPQGFMVDNQDPSVKYVLKLNKSLYGLKQAVRNWYQCLSGALETRGLKQTTRDSCVFLGHKMIVIIYVDDFLIFTPKGSKAPDRLITSLQRGHEKFEFVDQGSLTTYLGLNITHKDGKIHLMQPHLINTLLKVFGVSSDYKVKKTPETSTAPLRKGCSPIIFTWNYRQVIGILTYIAGTSRPDISFAVHQASRFSVSPCLPHDRAICHLDRYILETKDKGIVYNPDPTKGLECFVDADFSGNWDTSDKLNPENVLSRTGYVVMYEGFPVLWCRKLQTEISLSTTGAEYIALSQDAREVLPFMNFLKEISTVFKIHLPTPKIFCKMFEDNNSTIALAKAEKFSPRTKHIAIKYHHFRHHVINNDLLILPIDTCEQTADIFTKPLNESLFPYLRGKLNGWNSHSPTMSQEGVLENRPEKPIKMTHMGT